MSARRLKLASGLAAGLALVFLVARPWRNQPASPPVREASLSELVRRDDRMYLGGETEPFSGVMIGRYPSGALMSKSELVRGILHGVSEGWHTNGVLQVREHFQEGVSHGVRTKWFADGRKISEATIENGQVVGEFRRWHENGALAESINLTNGSPEGVSWAFYPSGFAQATARHENGALVHRESWKDGEHKTPLPEASP